MEAATRSVPEPLLVKRELVEANLFIWASSLGKSVNETCAGAQIPHCYQTKAQFYLAFPS